LIHQGVRRLYRSDLHSYHRLSSYRVAEITSISHGLTTYPAPSNSANDDFDLAPDGQQLAADIAGGSGPDARRVWRTLLALAGPPLALFVAISRFLLPDRHVVVFGHLIGTTILGLALWRSHAGASWAALLLAVSQPIHLASVMLGNRPLDLVGWGGTALGFAAAGWALLRMNNADFDLPAEPSQA
jgi:hypothetical protein